MVWLMIALAVGIIVGNLLLVKHTASMKMPSLSEQQRRQAEEQDRDDWDEED